MPHNDFYNFIFELGNILFEKYPFISVVNGINANLRLHFINVTYSCSCKLFDKFFLRNVFVKFKIFTSTKFLNRSF